MDLPVGLVLHKNNMDEIEYILNAIIHSKVKELDACYISISTKSYISKFNCNKIRIFKFNDLYRLTFNEEDYENTKDADYQCFSIDEKHSGNFKFTVSFSEGHRPSTNTTHFEIHLDQFLI